MGFIKHFIIINVKPYDTYNQDFVVLHINLFFMEPQDFMMTCKVYEAIHETMKPSRNVLLNVTRDIWIFFVGVKSPALSL